MRYYLDQSIFGVLTAESTNPNVQRMQETIWQGIKVNIGEKLPLSFNPISVYEALGYVTPVIPTVDINQKFLPLEIENVFDALGILSDRFTSCSEFTDASIEARITDLRRVASRSSIPVDGLIDLYIGEPKSTEYLRSNWGKALAWDYLCSSRFLVDPMRDHAPLVFTFCEMLRLRDARSGYRLAESLWESVIIKEFKGNKRRLPKRRFRLKPPGRDLLDCHLVQSAIMGSYSPSESATESEPVTIITCDQIENFKNRIRVAFPFLDWVLHTRPPNEPGLTSLPKFCPGQVVFFSRPSEGFKFLERLNVRDLLEAEQGLYDRPAYLHPQRFVALRDYN